jgi:hypothetical protein
VNHKDIFLFRRMIIAQKFFTIQRKQFIHTSWLQPTKLSDTCTIKCSHTCFYCIVTYSGVLFHDGTLLHSKSQYTSVKHSQKLFEHTYTSDPYGLGTLTPIEFFQQDLLWQSSNTHSHSCSQKASK